MSFGTNVEALFRRAAHYVDKILKGAKPRDLPVEQPTKFDLVLNLKTARKLGVPAGRSRHGAVKRGSPRAMAAAYTSGNEAHDE